MYYLPLSERFDWRCAPQRGDLSAATLIDPPAGDRRVVLSAGSLPLLVAQYRFDLALPGIFGVVLTFIILNLIFWRYYRPVSPAS